MIRTTMKSNVQFYARIIFLLGKISGNRPVSTTFSNNILFLLYQKNLQNSIQL